MNIRGVFLFATGAHSLALRSASSNSRQPQAEILTREGGHRGFEIPDSHALRASDTDLPDSTLFSQ